MPPIGRLRFYAFLCCALVGCSVPVSVAEPLAIAHPNRIVSMNVCLDQILMELVPRNRIAAVSYLTLDPTVSAAVGTQGLKTVYGKAEEVFVLRPDLVIAGEYQSSDTIDLLRRVGINVVVVAQDNDLTSLDRTVRELAALVGESANGEELIARSAPTLKPEALPEKDRPTAIEYQVSGYVSGPGSFMHKIIEAAGFRNLAVKYGIGQTGLVSLETLLEDPPDLVLVTGDAKEYATVLADNLRHPAFAALLKHSRMFYVPRPLAICEIPKVNRLVDDLISTREEIVAARSAR